MFIEEKVDGASVGLCIDEDGNPIIRNSDHILGKGYVKKSTPAKLQFRPIWNFFYDNKEKFQAVKDQVGGSIYAEWMWMQHGLEYDRLPNWLITYDVYIPEKKHFLCPEASRKLLTDVGFEVVPLLHQGPIETYEQLDALAYAPSAYTTLGQREGIYIKISDGESITHRFKMVRSDFKQGALFSDEMKKNTVVK